MASSAAAEPDAAQRASAPTDAGEPHTVTATDVLPLVAPYLPMDVRARAAAVAPAWRDALLAPALWRVLNLSARGLGALALPVGLPDHREPGEGDCVNGSPMLGAVAARAGGALAALDLSDSWRERHFFSHYTVQAIVDANAASLRELRLAGSAWVKPSYRGGANVVNIVRYMPLPGVRQLLEAATALKVMHVDVEFTLDSGDGPRPLREDPLADPSNPLAPLAAALRREPPFGPLRVRRLRVVDAKTSAHTSALLALLRDAPGAAELEHLELVNAALDTQDSAEALAAAALAMRLPSLALEKCELSEASAAPLASIVRGGALAHLRLQGRDAGDAGSQGMEIMLMQMIDSP
jgi:hypothetical protein